MICKEDVTLWYKTLESYERIEIMCMLLDMCLPFELRYVGTYLEELGRRDSQELRGVELRVSNSQELANDIAYCQGGKPSDMKVRRKMALYLAMIRTCNQTNSIDLFKTLESWGEQDFPKFCRGEPQTLQELLLVYMMATYHPIFSTQQRLKLRQVFNKIHEIKDDVSTTCDKSTYTADHMPSQARQSSPHLTAMGSQLTTSMSGASHSTQLDPNIILSQSQQQTGTTYPYQYQMISNETQLLPNVNPDGTIQPIMTNMLIQDIPEQLPSSSIPWAMRAQNFPGHPVDQFNPVQSNSPSLSPRNSPVESRSASPPKEQQQHHHNPNVVQFHGRRLNRKTSLDTVPPSPMVMVQMDMSSMPKNLEDNGTHLDSNQITQYPNLCNGYTRPMNVQSMNRPIGKSSHISVNTHPQGQQQPQPPQHQQIFQQSNQPQTVLLNPSGIAYTYGPLQSMNIQEMTSMLADTHLQHPGQQSAVPQSQQHHALLSMMPNAMPRHFKQSHQHHIKSGGSDSGSSVGSGNDNTPPETPALVSTTPSVSATGLSNSGISSSTSPLSGTVTVVSTNSGVMPPHISPSMYPLYQPPHLVPGNQRQQQGIQMQTYRTPIQYTPNGEILYQYATQSGGGLTYIPPGGPVVGPGGQQQIVIRSSPSMQAPPTTTMIQTIPPQMYPMVFNTFPLANKTVNSCYNCGSQSHIGQDCQEASFEDVTRASSYKLDFTNSSGTPSQSHQNQNIDNSGSTTKEFMDSILVKSSVGTSTSK